MTNFEFYKDKILDIVKNGNEFGKTVFRNMEDAQEARLSFSD